ncbi:AAA family ATPase [Epilithonimonas hominis]|uniref:AAA family ATPase n=1 Tax=Epilithonimonas hominis TaxID=420404 RepID=UPI000EEC543F|nr:AAA family ATPase [Epilithonimonas hominis]HAP94628.1 hypothetical protein [Chryseobacterium sp.]
MENQHLTYFKVENFKKFDSLEVKDIGQFNLVVGDNNVGKTCLLEALLIDKENKITNTNYIISLLNRKILNFNNIYKTPEATFSLFQHLTKKADESVIKYKLNDWEVSGDITKFELNLNFKDGLQKQVISDKNIFNLEISHRFFRKLIPNFNYPLISLNSNEDDIVDLYNALTTKKDKENLIEVLKVIFPLILDLEYKIEFKQIFDTFIFSFKDKDEFIPLNYLGDGFKRIFYIILKVLSLKGKRIMIDEIEIGIHYSKQKEFLKNIIIVCNELDVQLFATTHSEECAEAFVDATKELNIEKKCRLITLKETNNNIVAYTKSIDELETAIENDFNFRG